MGSISSFVCARWGQDAAKQNVKCERFVNLKSNEIRVFKHRTVKEENLHKYFLQKKKKKQKKKQQGEANLYPRNGRTSS